MPEANIVFRPYADRTDEWVIGMYLRNGNRWSMEELKYRGIPLPNRGGR